MRSFYKFCVVLAFGAFVMSGPVSLSAQEHDHSHDHKDEQREPVETGPAPEHIHGDIIYGSADAPVEVIEYISMTCPACKAFNDEVSTELLKEMVPSGKVRLVFRNFVRDRADLAVALLTRCTTDVEQSKRLISIYFDRQQEWMRAQQVGLAIQSIASMNGIPYERIQTCTTDRALVEHMVTMRDDGVKTYDIHHTPTIVLNGTKAKYSSYEDFIMQVRRAVALAEQ